MRLLRMCFGFGLVLMAGVMQARAAGRPFAIYDAAVSSTGSSFDNAGSITVIVSQHGMFTGKLLLGENSYPLLGRLNGLSASVSVGGFGVNLSIDPGTMALTGTVAGSSGTSYFAATADPFGRQPAPAAGYYTAVVPPYATPPLAGGYFSAKVTVDVGGRVRIIGRTGAGMPFSTLSIMDAGGGFPIYAVVEDPSDTALRGYATFRTKPGSDFDGNLTWTEDATGLTGLLPLYGSHYAAPKMPVQPGGMPFATGTSESVMLFGVGGNSGPAVPVTVSAIGISSSSADLANLKVDARTGNFSGTFRSAPFYGVALQSGSVGAGAVLNSGSISWVWMVPTSVLSGSDTVAASGGTLTLTGSNPHVGWTFVSGSTPTVGNGSATAGSTTYAGGSNAISAIGASLGSGALILGGSTSYNVPTTVVNGGLLNDGSGGAVISLAGGTTVNGGTLIFGNGTGNYTGVLTGSSSYCGGLTVNGGGLTSGIVTGTSTGSGTVVLTGSNTYSGSTTINGGTLNLGGNGGLGLGGSNAGTLTDVGGGALASGGSLTLATSGGVISGSITGSGGLTEAGSPESGTVVITHPGTLTFNPGVIVSGTLNLPDGTVAVSGSSPAGTVIYSGTTVWSGGPVLSGTLQFGQPAGSN